MNHRTQHLAFKMMSRVSPALELGLVHYKILRIYVKTMVPAENPLENWVTPIYWNTGLLIDFSCYEYTNHQVFLYSTVCFQNVGNIYKPTNIRLPTWPNYTCCRYIQHSQLKRLIVIRMQRRACTVTIREYNKVKPLSWSSEELQEKSQRQGK